MQIASVKPGKYQLFHVDLSENRLRPNLTAKNPMSPIQFAIWLEQSTIFRYQTLQNVTTWWLKS
jgi:hypothetical protein